MSFLSYPVFGVCKILYISVLNVCFQIIVLSINYDTQLPYLYLRAHALHEFFEKCILRKISP